jgi:hypothetical protein
MKETRKKSISNQHKVLVGLRVAQHLAKRKHDLSSEPVSTPAQAKIYKINAFES